MDGEKAQVAHGTQHEILFLRSLGNWSEDTRLNGPSRRILLERYLHACRLRRTWGDIDQKVVMDAAREMARYA